jgi:translation initiation factor 2 beta subunit (eIF-2beta)/eIF-5
MTTSRELQGKHDASAEVSEIPSPESELATPSDEQIFELPHERALRGKESDVVILPERKREDIVPSTASTAEHPQEQERGRSPTRAKVFTSAKQHNHIVPSTKAVPEKPHEQDSLPQQPMNSTAIPGPEHIHNDIVPPTASMAEVPHERGRSPPRPEVFTLAKSKPGYIVPSTNTLPALSRQHASRPQQTESNSPAVPESLDTPAERAVRTNLPSISTNQSSEQEFVAVFDDSSDESEKPVNKPEATPVERKDSAMDHPATDTSGVPPLKIHDKLRRLVPYATPLSIRDLERCWALEQDCFGGRDYCTKEQVSHVCRVICEFMLFPTIHVLDHPHNVKQRRLWRISCSEIGRIPPCIECDYVSRT